MKKSTYLILFSLIIISACDTNSEPKKEIVEVVTANESGTSDINFNKYGLINLEEAKDFETVLCQQWVNLEDYEDARYSKGNEVIDPVFRGFQFYKNKTVIKSPHTDYKIGSWELSQKDGKKMISITYKDNSKEVYRVAFLNPYSLKLINVADENEKIVDYFGRGIAISEEAEDPFALQNNTWRQKPSQKENKTALINRLKNNIHFFTLFYDYNINSKAEAVNFTGLPTCFTWYAGGIYLQKRDKLKPGWNNCFYNETQAKEAFDIADELLNFKYSWPEGETNWLKQNVFVLKQMEQKIDSLKL